MADDINARLNAILSDPAALSQVMSLARNLMGDQNSQAAGGSSAFSVPSPNNLPQPDQSGFPVAQSDPTGSIPASISMPKPANQGQMKLPKDDRCELLSALKPFLRESRSEKIDMMIRVLQISKLAKRR